MVDVKKMILEMADVEEIKNAIKAQLVANVDPTIFVDVLSQALEEVGRRYERGEFFLSELIMAGYIASEISNMLKPHLSGTQRASQGRLVIGTVKGDIHDIGKNIVIMMLNAAGYEVIDLGVDVPTDKFVEAVKQHKPDILGMSALLTSTMNEVATVIEALDEQGLRTKMKVIVGGRPITPDFAEEIGADGFAVDSIKAISLVKDLLN